MRTNVKKKLIKAITWIFLGPDAQEVVKTDSFLQIATANAIAVVGSFYLMSIATISTIRGTHPFSQTVTGYISTFIFAIVFTVIHRKNGIKYFKFARLAIILNMMILYGFIYA
ncbi:MAG: hypothetical protein LBC87_00190, partial [Fibromonadaceae bacterium]|nr:hypothetical protein [Fibromonadaceae bacterium]